MLAFGTSAIVLAGALAVMILVDASQAHDDEWKYFIGPVVIDGDEALAVCELVSRGSGDADDPFIIEGVMMDSSSCALVISNTTKHLSISDSIFTGGSYQGISMIRCSNIRIINSSFNNWKSGILTGEYDGVGCSDIIVRGCHFTICKSGIETHESDNMTIEQNDFQRCEIQACFLNESSSVTVSDNMLFPSEYRYLSPVGIRLCNVTDGKVSGNRIIERYYHALVLEYCDDVEVSDNNMSWNLDEDISIINSRRIDVFRNTITEARYHSSTGVGIYIGGSSECAVVDNLLGAGHIMLNDVDNSTIEGNAVYDAIGYSFNDLRDSEVISNLAVNSSSDDGMSLPDGMSFSYVKNVSVIGNSVTRNSKCGMLFFRSSALSIRSNTYIGNGEGDNIPTTMYGQLTLLQCEGAIVSENVFSSSYDFSGFMCQFSSDIETTMNRFVDSNSCFVVSEWLNITYNSFEGDCVLDLESVNNSEMYGNNLMTGYTATERSAILTMDAGYPAGGNYWANYTGVDQYSGPDQDILGSDGIGDSPVVVGESVLDRYPLIHPVEIHGEWELRTFPVFRAERGNAGWFISDVRIDLETVGMLDVPVRTMYRLDSADWSEYEDEIVVTGNGVHEVEYFSSGNGYETETPHVITIRIDIEEPRFDLPESAQISYESNPVDLKLDSYDDYSTICYQYSRLSPDNGLLIERYCWHELDVNLVEGRYYSVSTYVIDIAGNYVYLDDALTVTLQSQGSFDTTFEPYGTVFIICAACATVFGVSAIVTLYIEKKDWPLRGVASPKQDSEREQDTK